MTVDLVHVFSYEGKGGNPCPVVCDAAGMSDSEMQAVARDARHESGFVLPADGAEFDYRFRYWVPNHEMEMCSHATVGALWLLAGKGLLAALLILTAWNMSEPHKWPDYMKLPASDRILLILTCVLTVLVDLTVAIGIGVSLGLAFRLKNRTVTPESWSAHER